MNGFLNKKINHRIKNWLAPVKYAKMQSKNAVRNQYTNLYAYAANNPVRYIDPDGRTNVAINSTYKMNSKTGNNYDYNIFIIGTSTDDENNKIYKSGCAITAIANLASTLGLSYNPSQINNETFIETINKEHKGEMKWDDAAVEFSMNYKDGDDPFTYAMYDQQENDTANNYRIICACFKYTNFFSG